MTINISYDYKYISLSDYSWIAYHNNSNALKWLQSSASVRADNDSDND